MADNDRILARKGIRIGNNILTGIIGIWAGSSAKYLNMGIEEIAEVTLGPADEPVPAKPSLPVSQSSGDPIAKKSDSVTERLDNVPKSTYDPVSLQPLKGSV